MNLKNRALSPFQTLGWVAGLALAGVVVYFISAGIGAAWHRRKVHAAIPKYLDGLRAQRNRLASAIQQYHHRFGFYPQNHSPKADRALLNPLYYELVGTRWSTNFAAFRLPTTKDTIRPDQMLKLFGSTAFSNSLAEPNAPTNFLGDLGFSAVEQEDVIMVNSSAPETIEDQLTEDFATTPWRYSADPAEHNKGRFDLWIELDVLDQHFLIGNWDEHH